MDTSDGVSRLGLGLETRFLESLSRRSQVSSRALSLETLHRLFFMNFCKKKLLKKRFKKMIIQNSAVQRDQWLSFLCCYVVCEMEKTMCPLPRLKFVVNSIKICMYQGTEVYNLCKETLGVAYFAKDYL